MYIGKYIYIYIKVSKSIISFGFGQNPFKTDPNLTKSGIL